MKRAVVVLGTFAVVMLMHRLLWLVPFYRELHEALPFYVAESMKSVLQVAVCIVALLLLGERRVAGALALDRGALRGLAFGLACSAPMLIGFARTRGSFVPDPCPATYPPFPSPFLERSVSRGSAFRALPRVAWPLWT